MLVREKAAQVPARPVGQPDRVARRLLRVLRPRGCVDAWRRRFDACQGSHLAPGIDFPLFWVRNAPFFFAGEIFLMFFVFFLRGFSVLFFDFFYRGPFRLFGGPDSLRLKERNL